MPSLSEELTEMQIARGWEHVLGKYHCMFTLLKAPYKQGSCCWCVLETICWKRDAFSLTLYSCSHEQVGWVLRIRNLWRVDCPLVGGRTLMSAFLWIMKSSEKMWITYFLDKKGWQNAFNFLPGKGDTWCNYRSLWPNLLPVTSWILLCRNCLIWGPVSLLFGRFLKK